MNMRGNFNSDIFKINIKSKKNIHPLILLLNNPANQNFEP